MLNSLWMMRVSMSRVQSSDNSIPSFPIRYFGTRRPGSAGRRRPRSSWSLTGISANQLACRFHSSWYCGLKQDMIRSRLPTFALGYQNLRTKHIRFCTCSLSPDGRQLAREGGRDLWAEHYSHGKYTYLGPQNVSTIQNPWLATVRNFWLRCNVPKYVNKLNHLSWVSSPGFCFSYRTNILGAGIGVRLWDGEVVIPLGIKHSQSLRLEASSLI
ncbi:hypothetical protein GGS21DRAFT_32326 [Xylaria nigripes]|nr:hypothetical protein GGS21DRAFT_32326 [Xylaria nigripes]